MEEVLAIKDYLKKIQTIINYEATFDLFGYKIIKKSRVDDLMCCIYAKLPDDYKRILKIKKSLDKYTSALSYNLLVKHLSVTLFFDKSQIIVSCNEINRLIDNVNRTLERDINRMELEKTKGII